MQKSSPEFPAWSADTMNQSIADDSSKSTIEGFKNSELLQTFLNISQDGIMLDPNTKGGNTPMRPDMQGENTANTQMDTSSLQPAMQGGNTLNIQIDTTNQNMDVQKIMNNTDMVSTVGCVAGVNPVSLKMNSIQCLLVNTVKAAPSSFFSICVDYMSWHPQTRYRGSMTLPQCMYTKTKMMELQQHPTQEGNMHKSKSSQVTLYGTVKVDLNVKQYLLNQAAT